MKTTNQQTISDFSTDYCKSGAPRSALLIFILALALLPMLAHAQVNYAIDGGTAYVTNSPNASGNIVIASTYNGYPVTAIVYAAFASSSNLMSVTIPGSVTNIGWLAFNNCASLTNITVASANPNYSSIDGVLFNKPQTILLRFPQGRGGSYAIPSTVTDIEGWAFERCANLTSVTIPDGATYIGWAAFASCVNLANVTIPNSVTHLENQAFSSCINLTTVVIPDGVTSIGGYAFDDCISLANVTFGNSVASIGESAFHGCLSLTNVAIPDSVTSIGSFAFNFCTGLTSVTIGDGVNSIWGIFNGCTNLLTVVIGSGVNDIDGSAFFSFPSLTDITVVASNLTYSSINGVLFDKAQTTLITYPKGRGERSYVIPTGVTFIGNWALAGCANLTSVTIPNGATSIGYKAFSSCTSLTNVTIPASVSNFGDEAFIYCSNLPSVTIPAGLTYIGANTFYACTSLTNITVATSNSNYSSIDGVLFNKPQTILLRFPEGRGGSYVIPASVINIWDFSNCTKLTSVTMPNSVIGIGSFSGCTGLTSVVMGNSVANIGQSAFNSCLSLTSVLIPATVTNIGSSAFSACASLTNLTFLGDRPALGNAPFSGVAADATVYYYFGTIGWGATYGGVPTVMLLPRPQVESGSAGPQPDGFGFSIAGIFNQIIVVEASTNLANWQPIWTNILSGASANFTDAQWMNYPNRFYRVGGSISLLLVPNLAGDSGSQTNFVVTVPAGKTSLQISTSGGTGDCDLYVRFGTPPTLSTWDYRPYLTGNNESVTISNPAAGNWYVMVHGYENYSGVTLRAK